MQDKRTTATQLASNFHSVANHPVVKPVAHFLRATYAQISRAVLQTRSALLPFQAANAAQTHLMGNHNPNAALNVARATFNRQRTMPVYLLPPSLS